MKTLKLQNVPAVLVFVTWCTALLIVCIGAPNNFWAEIDRRLTDLSAKDGILLTLTPLISLIASGLFSPIVKAAIVFWRVRNVLPGHRAFSIHARADPRIDLELLRKRVVPWPNDPAAENHIWYGLYRSVQNAIQVVDAHRSFLLARDLTSIALTFIVVGAPTVLFVSSSARWTLTYGLVAMLQYAIMALVARNHGVRFVRNVLVEVSHQGGTSRA